MDFRPMNDVERLQLISALRNMRERNRPIHHESARHQLRAQCSGKK